MEQDWKGIRYICLVRQSNDDNGDDSVQAQLKFLRTECDADGMVYVDEVVLDGVTGSLPARRAHYTQLIERKLKDDDFDCIAIQRIDRATRGGGDFGIWLETQLKLAGIRIRYVGEDLPTGRHSSLIKVVKMEGAKETAIGTGQRSAQGQQLAVENGTLKTTGPTPYGCWRIYYSAEGVATYIIRPLKDGLQERLHPETCEVTGKYGTIVWKKTSTGEKKRKIYGRYKKQKSETVLLRPGDPDDVRIVKIIFFLWFRWGWKGKKISSLLNKRGVPSPWGKNWSQRQVESVVENEAYTGQTINGETYRGIYARRKKGRGFEALNRDEMELLTRTTMPVVYNPLEERTIVDQTLMTDYLPPHIRRLAIAYHERVTAKKLDPERKKKKKKKTKHPNSEYLLSDFMVAKQDGETLIGQLCGRKDGPKTPYYRHRRGRRGYEKGSVFNNLIPRLPLDQELVRFVSSCLMNLPDLRDRLSMIIDEQRRHAAKNDESLEALEAEREEVRERVLWISRQSVKTREDAAPELNRLDARRDELDDLIAQRQSQGRPAKESMDQIINRAIARCQKLADELPNLPAATMRELVRFLCPRVECDMATKEVEASIALPSFILEARKKPAGAKEIDQNDFVAMCLGRSSWSSTSSETHPPNLRISEGICTYQQVRGSNRAACYECRRRLAA